MCGACPSIVWLWHRTPATKQWCDDQTSARGHWRPHTAPSPVYSLLWRVGGLLLQPNGDQGQRIELRQHPVCTHPVCTQPRLWTSGGWISSSSDHRSIGAALGESVWDQDRPCQGGKTTETVMMFHVVFFDRYVIISISVNFLDICITNVNSYLSECVMPYCSVHFIIILAMKECVLHVHIV